MASEVSATEGARREGILEARWFRRPALDSETVYSWIVTARPWASFRAREYATEISPPRRARF